MRSQESTCLVAVSEEDEDQIFGWVVRSRASVFYIYVRENFRRKGIAASLLGDAPSNMILCLNFTKKGDSFLRHLELKRGLRFGYCS